MQAREMFPAPRTLGSVPVRALGGYTLDMKMKTYPMYPVGMDSLWNVWPYKATVKDGEGAYPDDGVWYKQGPKHHKRGHY